MILIRLGIIMMTDHRKPGEAKRIILELEGASKERKRRIKAAVKTAIKKRKGL